MAEHDPATGCLNRRGFARALDSALTRALQGNGEVALLALDLDHFKRINDQFGHSVGDAVLRDVAMTLAETARHSHHDECGNRCGTRVIVAR